MKLLSFKTNLVGDEFSDHFIDISNGVYKETCLNCQSSKDLELGTCLCVNHPTWMEKLLTTTEAQALGVDFENWSLEQFIFDSFRIELTSLVDFIKIGYSINFNPLPHLRELTSKTGANIPVEFTRGNKSLRGTSINVFKDSEGAFVILILVNNDELYRERFVNDFLSSL